METLQAALKIGWLQQLQISAAENSTEQLFGIGFNSGSAAVKHEDRTKMLHDTAKNVD